jgi:hypothetical protein
MSSYRVCVEKALLRLDAGKVRDTLAETFKDDSRGMYVKISESSPWSVTYELRDWDFPKERDDPGHEWDDDASYDWNMEAQSEAFEDTWEPAYLKERARMVGIAESALASVKQTIGSIEYEWGDKNYFYLTVTMNPAFTPPSSR